MRPGISPQSDPIVFRIPAGQGRDDLVAIPKRMIDRSVVVELYDPLTATPYYQECAASLLDSGRWISKRIYVTSARDGDGKTRTAFNLAASLAAQGRSVLLAEINFTQPRFRALLGNLHIRYGIDTAASGAALPEESVFSVDGSSLHLAAVRCPISAERLERCLLHLNDYFDWANQHYELLVIDSPSVLSPQWARWFHAFVGQALLVVREDRTPMIDIRAATRLLDSHLTGVWFNQLQQIPAPLAHGHLASAAQSSHASLAPQSAGPVSSLLAHASGALEIGEQISLGNKQETF